MTVSKVKNNAYQKLTINGKILLANVKGEMLLKQALVVIDAQQELIEGIRMNKPSIARMNCFKQSMP